MPITALVFALVWAGMLLIVRMSSVAGIMAAASAPITAWVLGDQRLMLLLLAFSPLVIWRHRDNIRRIADGSEPRVGKRAA